MAMFAKYLASSLGSHSHTLAAAAAATCSLLKISRFSTTTAGVDKPTGYPEADNTCPLSEFLLNECGLCQSELSYILKQKASPGSRALTAKHAVQLLRDSGFTEHQVRKTITRNPIILFVNADRKLKPKIEFMKTLGITGQDFGNAISTGSRLLNSSLEKTLRPNIQYLQNLFGSEANVSNVFKWAPQIIAKSNGPEVWEKKLKHLTSFGLLEDEIKELVRRHPLILKVSMDKVQKNMDFFMETAGLPAKFLLSNPQLVSCYSLERRIKPRHKVLSALNALQPLPRTSLISALKLNEQKFLEKYVYCSHHAKKLLDIFSGKSVLFLKTRYSGFEKYVHCSHHAT